jgi:hypothetical protein
MGAVCCAVPNCLSAFAPPGRRGHRWRGLPAGPAGPAARQPEPEREGLRERLRERIDRAEFEQLWRAAV